MRSALFKQADIVRAIRAARQAGLDVAGFEIAPDGTIRVLSKTLLPYAAGEARDAAEVASERIKTRPWAKPRETLTPPNEEHRIAGSRHRVRTKPEKM